MAGSSISLKPVRGPDVLHLPESWLMFTDTLLVFDRTQDLSQQLMQVQFPPPAPTPAPLQPIYIGRPQSPFRGKLIRTPDGSFIVGMSVFNNFANTYLFLYEVASGTILMSRTVTGQSTVLSMSPDGARFMAGFKPASLIHPGRRTTWYGDDAQRARAVALLNALLGSWGRKGGFWTPAQMDVPGYPYPP